MRLLVNRKLASPLEIDFENNFASVYGRNSLKYLQKEYGGERRNRREENHGDELLDRVVTINMLIW